MSKPSDRKIGAHVSAAGGIDKAVLRAAEIGCNCVQVFSGSPRVWARPPLDSFDTQKIYSVQQEKSVSPIVTHSLYLLNLASENPELLEKSRRAVEYDLGFDALVKGAGVVVHVGSHQGRGWDAVKDQLAREIAGLLERTPEQSHFLIENAAGQKGKIGSDLSEVRWLLDQVRSPRLGWAIDTCHAFAAGWALGSGLLEKIDDLQLWSTLRVVHVNDSRDPFGSGRDRHANLGEGEIPAAELRTFLQRPELQELPLILEVPGQAGLGPDAINIERLKALVE